MWIWRLCVSLPCCKLTNWHNPNSGMRYCCLTPYLSLFLKVAKCYFAQIVHAISYCHRLHVVHRDLKPENVVFFEKQGVVKLTDFGFSNRFQPGKKLNTSCGSLAYSAPEILLGDEYDAPAVGKWVLAEAVRIYSICAGLSKSGSYYQQNMVHAALRCISALTLSHSFSLPLWPSDSWTRTLTVLYDLQHVWMDHTDNLAHWQPYQPTDIRRGAAQSSGGVKRKSVAGNQADSIWK